jgi:hypothetical protein
MTVIVVVLSSANRAFWQVLSDFDDHFFQFVERFAFIIAVAKQAGMAIAASLVSNLNSHQYLLSGNLYGVQPTIRAKGSRGSSVTGRPLLSRQSLRQFVQ